MPRPLPTLSALALAIAASGCAAAGPGTGRYAAELARLEESCAERGGILTPSGLGRETGRPQTEYVCRINDGGTLLRD